MKENQKQLDASKRELFTLQDEIREVEDPSDFSDVSKRFFDELSGHIDEERFYSDLTDKAIIYRFRILSDELSAEHKNYMLRKKMISPAGRLNKKGMAVVRSIIDSRKDDG